MIHNSWLVCKLMSPLQLLGLMAEVRLTKCRACKWIPTGPQERYLCSELPKPELQAVPSTTPLGDFSI